MEEFVDYYKVLGISDKATDEEITVAFRNKVKELRPDINLDDRTREAFELVKKAKDTLTKPLDKSLYNLRRSDYYFSNTLNMIENVFEKTSRESKEYMERIKNMFQ